ncbi:MAG: DNA recombination protein RmuC [Provencibacterium sp.]|jgi:DNA recombination protein RmuC|nr:DNA recombination protein RmuC [Provencibacterium sp.]
MEWVFTGLTLLLLIALGVSNLLIWRRLQRSDTAARLEQMRLENLEQQRALRQEMNETLQSAIRSLGEMLTSSQSYAARLQAESLNETGARLEQRQDALHRAVAASLGQMEERLKTFALENEQKLESIRQTMERRLTFIQQDNGRQLEEMRRVVDEKLQQTLEERMTRSFAAVSERLEQVYRGLGEMQSLASGVGDLRKVLSNVKTRGILGELQLGAILEEILSPEQYARDVATRAGSRNMVEYAVKLPGEDGRPVWLPIDSKFPGETFGALQDAYETGSADQVAAAWSVLQSRLRQEAKDIHDKYIDPPNTTEFAILFLPFEGLYAEAVNRGMVEPLQRDFQVNLAGPSTMAALLNSLQMGFRTFAIQKRSAEVWATLSAVKTEFGKFADVLAVTQQRLEQANSELDKLVGVRTRQIQRRLKDLSTLEESAVAAFLPDEERADAEPPQLPAF